MGEIKMISPVPNLLCTKAIPAMTGGMEIFLIEIFDLSNNSFSFILGVTNFLWHSYDNKVMMSSAILSVKPVFLQTNSTSF